MVCKLATPPVEEYKDNCSVIYSTLLCLPPLRFSSVGGCLDRTQDSCDYALAVTRSKHWARTHRHSARSHPHTRLDPIHHSARSHPQHQLKNIADTVRKYCIQVRTVLLEVQQMVPSLDNSSAHPPPCRKTAEKQTLNQSLWQLKKQLLSDVSIAYSWAATERDVKRLEKWRLLCKQTKIYTRV